ncbi:MAG: hypothetical protein IJ875_02210 [Solobacterium sp.]|nr:hypothetical protein [Solobacterium sp.]
MKKPNKGIMLFQAALTIVCAIAAFLTLVRAFGSEADLLNYLNAIIYVLVFAYTIVYGFFYHKKEDRFFKLALYGLAAILGVGILYSGNLLKGLGLPDNLTLILNIANLIAFANVIKVSNILENKKECLIYMGIAVGIKFIVELYLIVLFINFVGPLEIITSLSAPILGMTLLLAYLHRFGE